MIPGELRYEEVVLLADIASTGISAAESADLNIGDTAAVFAQGPIGLCAMAGARLKRASLMESDPVRTEMAKGMGADIVLNHQTTYIVTEIHRLTGEKSVDVAIEALGTRALLKTGFEYSGREERSRASVYSGKFSMPLEPFAAGLGDHRIVMTLCPGGKERMRN